jgi:hypothetical protein
MWISRFITRGQHCAPSRRCQKRKIRCRPSSVHTFGEHQSGLRAKPRGLRAITVISTTGCRTWYDHPWYLVYINARKKTTAAYFNVVANADVGRFKVINCAGQFDEATSFAVGGTGPAACRTAFCPDRAPQPPLCS